MLLVGALLISRVVRWSNEGCVIFYLMAVFEWGVLSLVFIVDFELDVYRGVACFRTFSPVLCGHYRVCLKFIFSACRGAASWFVARVRLAMS